MPDAVDVLKHGLAELYKTGEFADFVIECGPYSFKVHKAVICAQSQYFRVSCGKDFEEGRSGRCRLKAIGEGEAGDDDAELDDPEAIKLMVHFFYHMDYTSEPLDAVRMSRPQPEPEPGRFDTESDFFGFPPKSKKKRTQGSKVKRYQDNVIAHARVFAAAVKYHVPALRELAVAKFSEAVEVSWDHTRFAEAVRIIYTTTEEDVRELRDSVVSTLDEHHELLDKLSIENAIKDNPALNFELLRVGRGLPAVPEKKVIDEGMKCAECGSWLYYDECSVCSSEYRGCCGGSCTNPQCLGGAS